MQIQDTIQIQQLREQSKAMRKLVPWLKILNFMQYRKNKSNSYNMEEEEFKQSLEKQLVIERSRENKALNRQNNVKKNKRRENQKKQNLYLKSLPLQEQEKENVSHTKMNSPKLVHFKPTFKLPKLGKHYSSRPDQKVSSPSHSVLYTGRHKTKNQLDFGVKSVTISQQINLKKVYMEKLDKILEEGNQLQKVSDGIKKKAKKLGRVIRNRYSKLYSNSKSIISGVESYLLDEQRNRKYKEQIRQLWMRSQK